MLNHIYKKIKWDDDLPYRSRLIDLYTRVYNGTVYDHLEYFYFQERTGSNGSYIPIQNRQPAVKTRFCKIVTDNSVSLLFGSDHFPKIGCVDEKLRTDLENIITEYKLNKIMARAATIGSTGSVIIFLRVFEGILHVKPQNTRNIFPLFHPYIEDLLLSVTERYKITGKNLIQQGYTNIEYPDKNYWFEREWNTLSEIYYLPYLCSDPDAQRVVDKDKTFEHNLGFVPAIWVKNLPQIIDTDSHGLVVDGACTFEPAIDTNIEIDYQLSQAGRALKYSADPLLVLKISDDTMMMNGTFSTVDGSGAQMAGMGNAQGGMPRSSSNAIVITKDDEAKLLEISGDACKAVLAYVRDLREYMVEAISGNRSSADKVTAAQSGRAMQAMNQSLIWLADHLRLSYGDCGLLKVLQMIIKITNTPGYDIIVDNKIISFLNDKEKIILNWPAWYPDTPADKVQNANAIKTLSDAAMLSKETGIKSISDNYSIEDIEEEEKKIESDLDKIEARQPKLMQTQSI